MPQIIRITGKSATDYQYGVYQNGWVLEIINDFDEYYTAKVLTGSNNHTDTVIAVHKGDCELINIGETYGSEPSHITTNKEEKTYGPMIGSDGEYGGPSDVIRK